MLKYVKKCRRLLAFYRLFLLFKKTNRGIPGTHNLSTIYLFDWALPTCLQRAVCAPLRTPTALPPSITISSTGVFSMYLGGWAAGRSINQNRQDITHIFLLSIIWIRVRQFRFRLNETVKRLFWAIKRNRKQNANNRSNRKRFNRLITGTVLP